jgi:hypothetical protein
VPFTVIPGVLVGTGAGYRRAFAIEMVLVDALGLYAAGRLARTVDRGRQRIRLAYVLAMVVIGPLLLLRFDAVPAVCVLLAAMFAAEGRAGPAAASLGYGTAAKIYPAVLAPLLVLGLAPALGWWRALRRTVPPFLAGFGLTVVPALVISARGVVGSALLYHVRRGVQLESLWANLIELAHLAARLRVSVVARFGAYDVQSSISAALKTLSGVATLAAVAAAAWLVWRRSRAGGGLAPDEWAGAFTVGVFAFMLPTRVLSPQYLIWLAAPMAALAVRAQGRRALWLLAGAATLSQLIFPFRYTQLRHLHGFDIGLLTVRNLLLVAVCWLVVHAFAGAPAARAEAAAAAADST